jgi:hypothetical protein
MVIKKIIFSTLVAGIALTTSCSNMNGSTNLGSEIVTNSDPNKTDFQSNFSFFDTIPVSFVKSVARENDTSIGYDRIRVGTSATKRESRGMFSFLLSKDYRTKHLKDTLQTIIFHTEQSTDTSKILATLSIYDYSDNKLASSNSIAASSLFKTLKCTYDSTTYLETYRDTLNQYGLNKIKAVIATDTSITTARYDVLITTDYNSLITLLSDAQIILTYKSASNTIISDSLTSDLCNHVIIESDSLNTILNTQSITSSETGRKAVFSLDLTALWDTLAKRPDFTTILSANFIIDDSILAPSDTTTTTFKYSYYISPTLFTDMNLLRDTLNSSLARSGTIKYTSALADTIKVTVQAGSFFRSMLSTKPTKVFLYIANSNNNSVIQETLWRNPVITDITFTNFK